MAELDRIFVWIGARTWFCRCAPRTWNQLWAVWDCRAARRLQSWRGGWSTLCCSHRTTDSVESKEKPGIRAPMGSSLFSRCRVCRQLLDGGTNHAELSNLAMSENGSRSSIWASAGCADGHTAQANFFTNGGGRSDPYEAARFFWNVNQGWSEL